MGIVAAEMASSGLDADSCFDTECRMDDLVKPIVFGPKDLKEPRPEDPGAGEAKGGEEAKDAWELVPKQAS